MYPLQSFLLVRHPNVIEKLRADVARFESKGDKITRTDLRNMPYLQKVMQESKFAQPIALRYDG